VRSDDQLATTERHARVGWDINEEQNALEMPSVAGNIENDFSVPAGTPNHQRTIHGFQQ
jgi:hypothetical protein